MRGLRRALSLATVAALAAVAASGARAQVGQFAQQQRGRYLVAAGDCAGCHTMDKDKPFAGGRPIPTPFGTIYAPNITNDAATGIGSWSDDQFYRAMHEGIAADGSRLYPAFPYPWFTKATRQDIEDIRAYLRTIPAVSARTPPNELPWPLSERAAMLGWDALYFKAGVFKPNPSKSRQWNRGAYLVEGLGHCGACHTPDNVFGAPETGSRFQGGVLDHWFAPPLDGDQRSGLRGWSADDIVAFLKNGENAKTVAYGPMAEVISNSTSKLSEADLRAIAAYLKSLPAPKASQTGERPTAQTASAGAAIYRDSCSACHRLGGEGVPGLFPPLKGDSVVQSAKPDTLLRLILEGSRGASKTGQGMPAYDWKLSDAQIAAVASYVRNAWGNSAPAVSSSDAKTVRRAGAVETVPE